MVFVLFLVGLLIVAIGPYYFPNICFGMIVVVTAHYFFKTVSWVAILLHNYRKFKLGLKSGGGPEGVKLNSSTAHVFIIPNYKEDINILRQTVGFLARHTNSPSYCVFLAMEDHEESFK